MKLKPSISAKLADPEVERVRRNLDERVTELQGLPFAQARVIQDISLPDGVNTPVHHGLGRRPVCVLVSPPRSATSTGRVTETRTADFARDTCVVLKADGFGATVTVDVVIL